ncbi:hypothetical protein N7512_007293 [Penicillium capsulatum]|nr:hypothetical protein N7512_007293 [Penicillium capsulatum]
MSPAMAERPSGVGTSAHCWDGQRGCLRCACARFSPIETPYYTSFEKPELYEVFRQKKFSLTVTYKGLDDVKTGFDAQVLSRGKWYDVFTPRVKSEAHQTEASAESGEESMNMTEESADYTADTEPIECLIVCGKAHTVQSHISSLKHRLRPHSTVLLLHYGLGVVEKLNQVVFPEPETRPHYISGIQNHGVLRKDHFIASHTSVGSTILCPVDPSRTPIVDAETDTQWAPTTKYLLRLLTLTPSLIATTETPTGLLQYQLERLALECLIGPMTALMDSQNGELLYSFSATRVMRLLLFEICSVIYALPELQGVPGVEHRFAPERLRRLALHHAWRHPERTSTMLQDLQARRSMDIDHFNGWVVAQGEKLGIKCVMNYMIQHLVLSKHVIHFRRNKAAIPMDFDFEKVLETGMSDDQPITAKQS